MKNKKMRGLFDEQFRMEKLAKQNDPLKKLADYIDFEFFRKPLEKFFTQGKDYSKGGRPAYDYVMMFKILILQRFYNLSDDDTEFAILDRLSFMRFVGLTLADQVPDAKTIWNYKNELAQAGVIEKLFSHLDKQLDQDGIIAHKGKMIDASFVEVPRQRNSREENKQIKQGNVPEDWHDNPHKLRQKDTDARWTKKNDISYFGYKNHIKADTKTKIITNYIATSAEVHDSGVVNDIVDQEEDGGQPLYADSAYRSDEIEDTLIVKKVQSEIHEKGYRGHPLTKRQKQRNRKKSKTRVRVEHIFGFMENSMNGMYIYSRCKVRAAATIGMMNLTYNLFRLVQMNVELSS